MFGPGFAHGFLQGLYIAIGSSKGDVGNGKAGAVAQRMAHFFDIKRAAGTGKKGKLLDFLA